MSKFQVGDKVQMLSGGPVGIIISVGGSLTILETVRGHAFKKEVQGLGIKVEWPGQNRVSVHPEQNLIFAEPPAPKEIVRPGPTGLVAPNPIFNRIKR